MQRKIDLFDLRDPNWRKTELENSVKFAIKSGKFPGKYS